MQYSISIQTEDFDTGLEYQAVRNAAPSAGAIVFFVGLVRDYACQENQSNSQVKGLFLEHFPEVTERLLGEIMQQANQRWPIEAARVVHRVGQLPAESQIVFVAVASAHRDHAYCASEFIMDFLKTRATIWKKEQRSDGDQWLGMKEQDRIRAQRWSKDSAAASKNSETD